MARYAPLILRRLVGVILTLLVTSFLVFFSLQLAPGDPVNFLLQGREASEAAREAVREQFGLDKPFLVQYWDWLVRVVQLDFGMSFKFRMSVAELLATRLPTTLALMTYSLVIIIVVGISLGAFAAVYRGRLPDRLVLLGSQALAAIPPFVAGVVLVALLSVQLGWFPVYGLGEGFLDIVWHLTLPAISLSVIFVALLVRITRDAMVEQFDREHVEVAISRGLSTRAVVLRHVFRNSLGPITTVAGILVAGMLVSGALIDQIFGLNGVGSLLVQSVNSYDFPVVQAIVLLVAAAFVIVNLIVDAVQILIDPRIAAGSAAR